MLQGHARDGISKLKAEQPWEVCESASLEAKVLGEQVTYGSRII